MRLVARNISINGLTFALIGIRIRSMGQCRICNNATDKGYKRNSKPWKSMERPFVYICDTCQPVACRTFNKRRNNRTVDVPSFDEWLSVLEKAWDSASQCFRCQISGAQLSLDSGSPVYLTLEHADNGQYMVVAFVINDMKSDLTLLEFQNIVIELAKRFGGDDKANLMPLLTTLSNFRRC